MSLKALVLVYFVGGLTFLPLIFVLVGLASYIRLPKRSLRSGIENATSKVDPNDQRSQRSKTAAKSRHQTESDAVAGYFAVCREYVPGGVNGKPPERSTPAGEVLAAESPSVYQSMYRSIFERGKTQIPTIDGDKRDGRLVKKARNVFFVVLRHDHLLLFDSSEQFEVRHVISILHHTVDIYDGQTADAILEGDLFVKRNCIRLTRKRSKEDSTTLSPPFYLFSDNCSDKEDFYHALLRAQSAALDTEDAPPPFNDFETSHLINLVQRLHSSDTDPQTRWLNALIGRLFLALYKTHEIETAIRVRIERKITRVPKPTFIPSIVLRSVDLGDAAPVLSNPRLKELTVDGTLVVEADVKYNGGFKIEVAALARLDLGPRIRAREVSLVLLGVLRRLTGHVLLKFKPAPSNRMWISFESMPQLDLQIEPVVSSRQITYTVILRAIESKIREVISETLVQPNWDDIPFLDTTGLLPRGGLWETRQDGKRPPDTKFHSALHEVSQEDERQDMVTAPFERSPGSVTEAPPRLTQKTMSMPVLSDDQPQGSLSIRRGPKSRTAGEDVAVSSSISPSPQQSSTYRHSQPPSPRSHSAGDKPKAMRSNSFATVATPLVSVGDPTPLSDLPKPYISRNQRDAAEYVKQVQHRGDSTSAAEEPQSRTASTDDRPMASSDQDVAYHTPDVTTSPSATDDLPEAPAQPTSAGTAQNNRPIVEKTAGLFSHASAGTNAAASKAKVWGWNVLHRQNGSRTSLQWDSESPPTSSTPSSPPKPYDGDPLFAGKVKHADLKEPMGRGQPLPPPGMPLPGPTKSLWASSGLGIGSIKRKPVLPPQLPPRRSDWATLETQGAPEIDNEKPPPLPVRSETLVSAEEAGAMQPRESSNAPITGDQSLVIVAAPSEEDEGCTQHTIEQDKLVEPGSLYHKPGGLGLEPPSDNRGLEQVRVPVATQDSALYQHEESARGEHTQVLNIPSGALVEEVAETVGNG